MTLFWLVATGMGLVACGFVLLPRWTGSQPDADRTQLNIALYRERQAALQEQLQQGELDEETFKALEAEAALELLTDTEGDEPQNRDGATPFPESAAITEAHQASSLAESAPDAEALQAGSAASAAQGSSAQASASQLAVGTEGSQGSPAAKAGGAWLLALAALLVPGLATFIYADWGLGRGAIAQQELVAQIRELPGDHPGYPALVQRLAAQVDAMPNPADARLLLAAAYFKLGEKEKAAALYRQLLPPAAQPQPPPTPP